MTTAHDATHVQPLRASEARLLRDDPAGFTARTGLAIAAGYLAFPGALDRIVEELEAAAPTDWGSHLLIDPVTRTVVGLGGYKGRPRDGTVEVGYSVAPEHRGRGHATNAVTIWVRRAAEAGVTTVLAHTLPEPNASTRVLERCGFERSEVLDNPEVGQVWRWRLTLGRAAHS